MPHPQGGLGCKITPILAFAHEKASNFESAAPAALIESSTKWQTSMIGL